MTHASGTATRNTTADSMRWRSDFIIPPFMLTGDQLLDESPLSMTTGPNASEDQANGQANAQCSDKSAKRARSRHHEDGDDNNKGDVELVQLRSRTHGAPPLSPWARRFLRVSVALK